MTELNDYYGRIFTGSQLTDDLKKKAKALPSVKKEKRANDLQSLWKCNGSKSNVANWSHLL